jgi:hypothetical protein
LNGQGPSQDHKDHRKKANHANEEEDDAEQETDASSRAIDPIPGIRQLG